MKLPAVVLLLASMTSAAQNSALVTIFRENHGIGSPNPLHATAADDTKIVRLRILIDNRPAVELRDGKFVTLRVQPGEHTLTVNEKWAEGELVIHPRDGEQVFVRPFKEQVSRLSTKVHLAAMDCHEAREFGHDTEPLKGKLVQQFPAVDEVRFPECSK